MHIYKQWISYFKGLWWPHFACTHTGNGSHITILPEEKKILSITQYKVLKWTVKPQSPRGGLSRKSGPHVAEPSTGPIPIKPKSAIKGFTLLKNHCSFLYLHSSDSQQVHSTYHGKKQQQAFQKAKSPPPQIFTFFEMLAGV
jgi:hypothetical protein